MLSVMTPVSREQSQQDDLVHPNHRADEVYDTPQQTQPSIDYSHALALCLAPQKKQEHTPQ